MTIVGAPLDLGQGQTRRRHGTVGDPLRGAGGAADLVRLSGHRPREPLGAGARGARGHGRRTRGSCPRSSRRAPSSPALVTEVVGGGGLPLVLGGDHSVALGTLAGLRAAAGEPGGVIWIDAHGDLNTPGTSPTGNVHGMPLAAAFGLAGAGFEHAGLTLPAVDPRRVVLVGVRSLDPAERSLIQETGIRAITMTEIDRIGIERAAQEAIDRASGPGFVHVSLDLDALDPEVAPGVGTPVKGGLTYREAHLACEDIAESGLVGSLELVEVNPILDRENASAAIAVELAASALGQSIL